MEGSRQRKSKVLSETSVKKLKKRLFLAEGTKKGFLKLKDMDKGLIPRIVK